MQAMGIHGDGGRTFGTTGLVALIDGLRDALRRRRVYRQTLRELRTMSRRELDDKGIGPGMITRLAAEAAYGKPRQATIAAAGTGAGAME